MKKLPFAFPFLLVVLFSLSGCGASTEKTTSMVIIYGTMAALSFTLLISYCYLVRKKDAWFLLLFLSVFIVNIGYLSLAISHNLEEALLANRISYLGSVFLPMAMLMIILNTIKTKYPTGLPGLLLCIGLFVFLVAASPGYLDIYYKEVTLETVNGVTSLSKVYGPWHSLYFVYLLGYFATMLLQITYAAYKKQIESTAHVIILFSAVFVNIGVWLMEQFVRIDFEILSVSYIISELFLLGLHLLMQENICQSMSENASDSIPAIENESDHASAGVPCQEEIPPAEDPVKDIHKQFLKGLNTLTQTEHSIYEYYIERKTTKEIMALLDIKENTLKFHNKNIYSKLGVSSRKQLMEIYEQLQSQNTH